jgi:hypothetical protein
MDKQAYEEIVNRQQEAETLKIKAMSDEVAKKTEANRVTSPDSPYRSFEIEFGASRFIEINNFIKSLDVAEFYLSVPGFVDAGETLPYMEDPLLLLCNKFLAWKTEVGSDRLFHEFNIRYDGSEYAENNEGSLYVIKKAWEQIVKEQEIIETARLKHKAWLAKQTDDDPSLPAKDPVQWVNMCNSFSEFEALTEFGYPLPFNTVFEDYKPRQFYYGKNEGKKKYFEKSE